MSHCFCLQNESHWGQMLFWTHWTPFYITQKSVIQVGNNILFQIRYFILQILQKNNSMLSKIHHHLASHRVQLTLIGSINPITQLLLMVHDSLNPCKSSEEEIVGFQQTDVHQFREALVAEAAIRRRESPPGRLGSFTAVLMVCLLLFKRRGLAHNASIRLLIKYQRLLDIQGGPRHANYGGSREQKEGQSQCLEDRFGRICEYTQMSAPTLQRWGVSE